MSSKRKIYLTFVLKQALLALLCLLSACSTQKNTWSTRQYHALTTRYNIRFNGEEAYKRGLLQIEQAHKEDFTKPLMIYPISNHQLGLKATSSMDICIDKCEKAIKQHSIRVKPEKKPSRSAPLKERLFYEQEEFNPVMGSVFLLMAQAQFHKAEFLSANSTCAYIIRHFSHDKDLCDRARILMARSYYESDWMYEAENIFLKMNEEGFSSELSAEYALAYADFLMKREAYSEAIPYLEMAFHPMMSKKERQRYTYLLAQLYQRQGNAKKADDLYKAVLRMNPPYEMDLNARIAQTELSLQGNGKSSLRRLKRMSRNPNNVNYLDAIYYAMANIHFTAGDTLQAVEHYRLAIDETEDNTAFKQEAMRFLGKFYYQQDSFLLADPLYQDLKSSLTETADDYQSVQERAAILAELAPHLQTIFDQDSLLYLASLPEERLQKMVDDWVSEAKKKAREEARLRNQQEALDANAELTQESLSEQSQSTTPDMTMSFGNDDSWYFYNEAAKNKGKKDFERLWGRRSLADNWRLKNKGDFFQEMTDAFAGENETISSDTLATGLTDAEVENAYVPDFEASEDPTQPGYYLQNIPFEQEQKEACYELIREALFQSGIIYREKMENRALALKTFRELQTRFPEDSLHLPESYYLSYLMLMQDHRAEEAQQQRQLLLKDYPESMQADYLRDEAFLAKLDAMYQSQDSLFAVTYQYFVEGASDAVVANCDYVDEHYPMSPLRPNFMFMRALEAVKQGDGDTFVRLIGEIAEKYPDTDLSALSSAMKTYWDEGRRPIGFDGFYLADGQTWEDSLAQLELDSLASLYSYNAAETHYLALAYSSDSINVNHLLFDVALYNFTNFLIRDYELSIEMLGAQEVLMIRSFENVEDVLRYVAWLNFQGQLPATKYPGLRILPISESNLPLLQQRYSEDAYRRFLQDYYGE
ncbi:MAG: tetratricopeptide repeat protein [Bacteroidales bacterium]|nr:tetratricopeptide repeat protein [Bacteroidales bacterium]